MKKTFKRAALVAVLAGFTAGNGWASDTLPPPPVIDHIPTERAESPAEQEDSPSDRDCDSRGEDGCDSRGGGLRPLFTGEYRSPRISDILNSPATVDVDVLFLGRNTPSTNFVSGYDIDPMATVRMAYQTGAWEFAYMGTNKWESRVDTPFGDGTWESRLLSVEANKRLLSTRLGKSCLTLGVGGRYIGLTEDVRLDSGFASLDSDNNLVGGQYVLDLNRAITRNIGLYAHHNLGLYANFAETGASIAGFQAEDDSVLAALATELRTGVDANLGRGWRGEVGYQMTYIANTQQATKDLAGLIGPNRESDLFAHGLVLGLSKSF